MAVDQFVVRLQKLDTCAVSDAQDKLGIQGTVIFSGRSLKPSLPIGWMHGTVPLILMGTPMLVMVANP